MHMNVAVLGACAGWSTLVAALTPPDGVPQYVVDYAPLLYLHPEDPYLPASLLSHLNHTTPRLANGSIPSNAPSPLTLSNLDQLSADVYLTSNDDITTSPAWLHGITPDSTGSTGDEPSAAVIVNDKGNGTVDAFYMYFYSFDYGGVVLGQNLGNHVGDWEHNMIRFDAGVPKWVWYSQHSNGEAFAYDVLEKSGPRPLVYVANGTHANYAIPGTHDHTIPDVNLPDPLLLVDQTSAAGPLYDPALSAAYYAYTPSSNDPPAASDFAAYDASAAPTGWLGFAGRWGDLQYPDSDPRQENFFGFHRFETGPTGPGQKQLNRTEVCPDNGVLCVYRVVLGP